MAHEGQLVHNTGIEIPVAPSRFSLGPGDVAG
jgi:hypothetical protein